MCLDLLALGGCFFSGDSSLEGAPEARRSVVDLAIPTCRGLGDGGFVVVRRSVSGVEEAILKLSNAMEPVDRKTTSSRDSPHGESTSGLVFGPAKACVVLDADGFD